MGYTITIGELEIIKHPDDGIDSKCLSFGAKGVHRADAPAFGDPTDYTNSRWPSYGVWPDALRQFGLYEVFYTESGHLIGGHPGVRLVTKELADKVFLALYEWRKDHPDVKPEHNAGEEASNLVRLEWLHYWLRWALENCETPVVVNS